jgi:hypothetical protein
MDGLAAATASAAGWHSQSLAAVYFETEAGCLERLAEAEAGFALVTLPLFLEHRQALGLVPLVQAVAEERAASEPWVLVAGTGQISGPGDLAGWEMISLAGHSPRFIRGPVLGAWGELPDSMSITFSGAVLSGLRRTARGEQVTLLLDGHQAASLDRLPFADELEVVYSSPPLPVSLLCAVGSRTAAERVAHLSDTLLGIDQVAAAAEALAGVRIDGFTEVDETALQQALASFEER